MQNRIDLEQIVQLQMSDMQKRLTSIALVVQNEWKNMASAYLRASAATIQEYKDAIVVDPIDGNSVRVVLRSTPQSPLPNMLEQGLGPGGIGTQGPIDLRTWLLKGRSSRVIRFDKSRAQVNSLVTKVFGRDGSNQFPYNVQFKGTLTSKRMESIQTMLDAMKETTSMREGAGGYRRQKKYGTALPSGLIPKLKASHSTDLLARMYKMTTNRAGGGSVYTTFRTITSSKPWIHPGIQPRNIAGKVAAKLPTILMEAS